MFVLLPLLINITLNFYIFHHVRRSSWRVIPHIVSELNNNIRIHSRRISRRDTRLLGHIIFMIFLFIIGCVYLVLLSIYLYTITNCDIIY